MAYSSVEEVTLETLTFKFHLADPEGFEPSTSEFGALRSSQLELRTYFLINEYT